MMKPQSVPPWAKETTSGLYTRYMALTRAIRANDNRAMHARDAQERAHYLAANQVLEKKRAQLAPKPPHQKDKNKAQSP
ncbi:hypothetical protein E4U03_12410 [Rothia nasimurium]|uniref:Uncharacterized protein n=1 Tax=Rothia nasimurium TaxID=85336 RepID=A0A4Y9F0Y4_9MICC|nr:hypothetical protein [Rothia nasimurium]MBF0809399.1 hypothetical protein [Rothia nasimurium]TFU19439.1 hypothetical protein E4U03_12410 [Rothia nasimurium]